MGLTFLKAENERDLPVETIPLDQISIIALAIDQLKYQHLN